MIDGDQIDLIRTYLKEHTWQHGHERTAERFGVSRQTLWRFLDRDQVGRRLPRAVLDSVGGSVEALEAATRALIAEPPSRSRPLPSRSLSDELHDALLHLCEAPLATAGELARLRRVPVSTLRKQRPDVVGDLCERVGYRGCAATGLALCGGLVDMRGVNDASEAVVACSLHSSHRQAQDIDAVIDSDTADSRPRPLRW